MAKQTRTQQLSAKYARNTGRAKGREARTLPTAIPELLDATFDGDSTTRCAAVQALCPCHVQADIPAVWDRLIALATDPELAVRKVVFHTLADGSPNDREAEVVATLEAMYQDPDRGLRRQVRQLLARYRRGGRINLL